jgi:MFS family permease
MKLHQKPTATKYFLFHFFSSLDFMGPVIVLFWLSHGLNMTQVMLLQSIYAIGVIILELPTGALADFLGKKISLIIGSALFSLGMIYYGFSTQFWQFVTGELIAASGMAFISGADSSLLYEMLLQNKQTKKFKKIEGQTQTVTQIARLIGNGLGGVIAQISLGLTLITTGSLGLISSLVATTFPNTQNVISRNENNNYLQIIKESLNISIKNRQVLWNILFFAFFNAIVFSTYFLAQPYMQNQGIPIRYFGVIFAGFNLISATGSFFTEEILKISKGKEHLLLTILTTVSFLLLTLVTSKLIIVFWAIIWTLLTINRTITNGNILDLVPPNKSATILSFQNLLRRLIYAVLGPIIGFLADTYSIQVALLVITGIFLVVMTSILSIRTKD